MAYILVTGGADLIGSNLVSRGESVRVLDDLVTGKLANLVAHSGVSFLKGDVSDRVKVKQAMQGVEIVFHQADLASVPRSIENPQPTHDACVTGKVVSLDEASMAGVRRVIFTGSSTVDGDQPWVSKRAIAPPFPFSPCAAAKLACETYCEIIYQGHAVETVYGSLVNFSGASHPGVRSSNKVVSGTALPYRI